MEHEVKQIPSSARLGTESDMDARHEKSIRQDVIKKTQALGHWLTREIPALGSAGLAVERKRKTNERLIILTYAGDMKI